MPTPSAGRTDGNGSIESSNEDGPGAAPTRAFHRDHLVPEPAIHDAAERIYMCKAAPEMFTYACTFRISADDEWIARRTDRQKNRVGSLALMHPTRERDGESFGQNWEYRAFKCFQSI